jgi:hypothetical protein
MHFKIGHCNERGQEKNGHKRWGKHGKEDTAIL